MAVIELMLDLDYDPKSSANIAPFPTSHLPQEHPRKHINSIAVSERHYSWVPIHDLALRGRAQDLKNAVRVRAGCLEGQRTLGHQEKKLGHRMSACWTTEKKGWLDRAHSRLE